MRRRLGLAPALLRRVGNGDEAHAVLHQPLPVRARGQVALVEERVVAAVELRLPAAGESELARHVDGLPAGGGRHYLDPSIVRADALELREQRHEVRLPVCVRGRRLADLRDRSPRLPEDDDDAREHDEDGLRAASRHEEQRPGDQDAEPGGVAAHRRRHDVGGGDRRGVERGSTAQQHFARRELDAHRQHDRERHQRRREVVRLLPAVREHERHRGNAGSEQPDDVDATSRPELRPGDGQHEAEEQACHGARAAGVSSANTAASR